MKLHEDTVMEKVLKQLFCLFEEKLKIIWQVEEGSSWLSFQDYFFHFKKEK